MYALGNAQIAAKQFPEAIATLKSVHAKAWADPKTPTNAKVAIDSALLSGYMQTNNQADATTTAGEIKTLDPTSTLPATGCWAMLTYKRARPLSPPRTTPPQ